MKKRLIIIIIICTIITFIIYRINTNNKIYFLALGDGFASGMTSYNVNSYSYNDYLKDYLKTQKKLDTYISCFTYPYLNSSSLLQLIKENKQETCNGKQLTIKQAIKKANLIVLSIGLEELNEKFDKSKITKKELNEYYNNVDTIFGEIKKLNNKKVIIVGLYQTNNIKKIKEINYNLKNVSKKYNYTFLDVSDAVDNQEYFEKEGSFYLNYNGHKKINELLQKFI